jgi:threonine dehydratase
MRTLDLSDNVLVKEHLRHLVGGHTCPINERIFQFAFPERPGSLALFLVCSCCYCCCKSGGAVTVAGC